MSSLKKKGRSRTKRNKYGSKSRTYSNKSSRYGSRSRSNRKKRKSRSKRRSSSKSYSSSNSKKGGIKICAADPSVVNKIERAIKKKGYFDFTVLDNGGHPFKVSITRKYVTVSDNEEEDDGYGDFSKTIKNVDQIWIGTGEYDDVYSKKHSSFIGNTALVVKGRTCISIASAITQFELGKNEKVTKYISTVGNSAVPYGWIETNKGYYAIEFFNCLTGYIPKEKMNVSKFDEFSLLCWRKGEYPFPKKIGPIKKFKVLVPRK